LKNDESENKLLLEYMLDEDLNSNESIVQSYKINEEFGIKIRVLCLAGQSEIIFLDESDKSKPVFKRANFKGSKRVFATEAVDSSEHILKI
jgi:hypothetical protein